MRPTRIALLAIPLAVALGCGSGGGPTASTQQSAAPAEFTEVTYAGLDAAVKEQKGKVVLIDVWSIT